MKLIRPVSAAQQEAQNIQNWIGSHGGNIGNAYAVNAAVLREMEVPRGSIEKVLWRVSREKPDFKLDTASLLKVLETKNLLRELRKQRRLDSKEQKLHETAFAAGRLRLIGSKVPAEAPNRDVTIREIEAWFTKSVPDMRSTPAIQKAAQLRFEAGNAIHLLRPPMQTSDEQVAAFERRNPGRVYWEGDQTLLVLKDTERAELGDRGLQVVNAVDVKQAEPVAAGIDLD